MKAAPGTARVWMMGAALLSALAGAGCAKILGIEKQELSDAGAREEAGPAPFRGPSAEQCSAYCETVKEACPERTPTAAFALDSYCSGFCTFLPLAEDPEQTKGNTFECRLQYAEIAKEIMGDNDRECRSAGPGNDGFCASNCENYCQLYSTICANYPGLQQSDCLSKCERLISDPNTDASSAFDDKKDTIQCRLAHLGAAAFFAADDLTVENAHCEHAAIYFDGYTPCVPQEPKCADYCQLTMNVCKSADGMQQYDSLSDCMNICTKGMTLKPETLPTTETQDKTRDTVACRRYHAYNHLLFGGDHCEHAGPGGDGHCGSICPAYCKQVQTACAAQGFVDEYNDLATCEQRCGLLVDTPEDTEPYNVDLRTRPPGSVQCLIYYTVKAFSNPTECASALGHGKCTKP